MRPATIARLKAIRVELIDPAISRHHGSVIKLMADGVLVAFESVVDAVACAAKIQGTAAARNAGMAEPERIVFRIGVNLGGGVGLIQAAGRAAAKRKRPENLRVSLLSAGTEKIEKDHQGGRGGGHRAAQPRCQSTRLG